MLTDRLVTAEEAERIGLVTRTVPDDELNEATDALVAKLAAGPTGAYAATKRLLDASWGNDAVTQMGLETESIADLAGGPVGAEGVDAFLAKRRPDFRAR